MTQTQADRAKALGMPPDRVEPPAFGHGDTATHDMLNLHPDLVQRDDVYQYGGVFRTVSSALQLTAGGNVFYFADPAVGEPDRATIPEGTLSITVYRPKKTIADA